MEKIKINLFDFFASIVPGLILLSALTTLFINFENLGTLEVFLNKINEKTYIPILIFSYIMGLPLNPLGSLLLDFKEKYYPIKKPKFSTLYRSQKMALVRELSTENFTMIEHFNIMKKMYSNVSGVLIISSIIIFLSSIAIKYYIIPPSILVSIVLLFQASKFHEWAEIDLDNTVNLFNLEAKSKNQ